MAKSAVEEFYGQREFQKFVKKATKEKFNGFHLQTLTKKEMLAVVGDLMDSWQMADQAYTELKAEYDKLLSVDTDADAVQFVDRTLYEETAETGSKEEPEPYNNQSHGVESLNDHRGFYKQTSWN